MEKLKALIRRQGNLIQVIPDWHVLLGQELTYTKRVNSGGVNNFRYEKTALYILQNNTLIAPAGMTRRIFNKLQEAGVAVTFQDLRTRTIGEPDFTLLDPLRAEQEDCLVQIVSNDWGIIDGPTGMGKTFLIKQMCKMWTNARIIICTPFKALFEDMYAQLVEMFSPNEVGRIGDGYLKRARITVCIDRSLMHCDLDNCDVLIFDEVHKAAAPKNSLAIQKVLHARRYGFSATPEGRSDRADMETEAMFGPIIYRTTYQAVQASGHLVPIHVIMVECSDLPVEDFTNPLVLDRRGIWRNEARNKRIRDAITWGLQRFGSDAQILTTVKTLDHLVHLSHELKPLNFAMVYGSMKPEQKKKYVGWDMIDESKHPITASEKERYQGDFKSGLLRRVICTANSSGVWGTGCDFPHLEIMVRADAQGGVIQNTQISGRVSRKPLQSSEHDPDELKTVGILIDFDDAFNRILGDRAKKRMTIYRKKGWKISTLNLAQEAMLQPKG